MTECCFGLGRRAAVAGRSHCHAFPDPASPPLNLATGPSLLGNRDRLEIEIPISGWQW